MAGPHFLTPPPRPTAVTHPSSSRCVAEAQPGWGPATLRELRGNHRPGPAGRWRAGGQAGRQAGIHGLGALPVSTRPIKNPNPGSPGPQTLRVRHTGLRPRSLPHLTHVARAAVGGHTHLLVQGRGGDDNAGLALQANIHGVRGGRDEQGPGPWSSPRFLKRQAV